VPKLCGHHLGCDWGLHLSTEGSGQPACLDALVQELVAAHWPITPGRWEGESVLHSDTSVARMSVSSPAGLIRAAAVVWMLAQVLPGR